MKESGLSSQGGLSELKSRLLFVFIGILIFRIGAHVPVPGLDPQKLAHLFNQQQNTILGFFNMFSGGALSRLTVFAIGIMPYISASIIIQLFSAVSPTLEQLKKEGEAGRRKINQYTRYLTLGLALLQSLGMSKMLVSQGIALQPDAMFYFTAVVTLSTGTMFLMWIGEQMTERGVGNGISLIIFAGITSRLPSAILQVIEQARQGQIQVITLILVATLMFAVVAFVVFVERAQRRITVNYAQRAQGRKMYAAQSSHLPLKINISGVIPPIILLPATLAQWFGRSEHMTWLSDVGLMLQHGRPAYVILFSSAIVFFAFSYQFHQWLACKLYLPPIAPHTACSSWSRDIPSYLPMPNTAYYRVYL